jgi:hypothetical protein
VRQDLEGDLLISGAGVPTGRTWGPVGRRGRAPGRDSRRRQRHPGDGRGVRRLFAGYAGPDDGSGNFNLPAVVGTVRVTGKENAFADSYLIATAFRNVSLASVDPDGGGVRFGVLADECIGRATVGAPTRLAYPGHDALGDFRLAVG